MLTVLGGLAPISEGGEFFTLTALRYSTGVGFRYVTPVGPLAFDVGVNLDPDETLNEPIGQIYFSIGAF